METACYSMLRRDHGGLGGYFVQFPQGYGYPLISGEAAVFGDTNDIRAPGSPPMMHWVETSITVATGQKSASGLKQVQIMAYGDYPWFYAADFTCFKTMTERIPRAGQSLMWKEMPRNESANDPRNEAFSFPSLHRS